MDRIKLRFERSRPSVCPSGHKRLDGVDDDFRVTQRPRCRRRYRPCSLTRIRGGVSLLFQQFWISAHSGPYRMQHSLEAACYYGRRRSVCFLATNASPAKTAEPIQMPFGLLTRVCPNSHVSDVVQIPTGTNNFEEMKTGFSSTPQSSVPPLFGNKLRSAVKHITKQVLLIWEECVATPHGRECTRLLHVLAVQCPLQTNPVTQPRILYIHTMIPQQRNKGCIGYNATLYIHP